MVVEETGTIVIEHDVGGNTPLVPGLIRLVTLLSRYGNSTPVLVVAWMPMDSVPFSSFKLALKEATQLEAATGTIHLVVEPEPVVVVTPPTGIPAA